MASGALQPFIGYSFFKKTANTDSRGKKRPIAALQCLVIVWTSVEISEDWFCRINPSSKKFWKEEGKMKQLTCFLSAQYCDLLCFPLMLQSFNNLALFSQSCCCKGRKRSVCVFAYSYLGERVLDCKTVYHVFASKEVLFCGEKRVCFTHESAFFACVSESILWAGLNMEIGRSWGIFPR